MSVTTPRGFSAVGVACGVKEGGALDLALVTGPPGSVGAAVFTTNRAAAAPVQLSRAHLSEGPATRAVVMNSGCANAATGDAGRAAALEMAVTTARSIDCDVAEVLVASTGTIGTALPVIRVTAGIEAAAGRLGSGAIADRTAAFAMMTTDTVPKQALYSEQSVTVGGMAKGAGMVRPDMATMLVVITTDAVAEPAVLDRSLRAAVDVSFHSLNIDGCPSTNDTVFVMASGASGVAVGDDVLRGLLTETCRDLAYQLAADAEGASRVVTLLVAGAEDDAEARRIGRYVTDSALVRASFFGGDPNWGRIVGALGASGAVFQPAQVSVEFGGTTVAARGVAAEFDEDALVEALEEGDFEVRVVVGSGPGAAEILTTDLTPDYVVFNGERS